jgi:hypothetical protein
LSRDFMLAWLCQFPLLPDAEEELRTLAAVEPLLIAGRVTSHPADWAMAVRIWPSAGRPAGRPRLLLAAPKLFGPGTRPVPV